MPRYAIQAIVQLPSWDGCSYAAGGETVIEIEKTPTKTGLIDQFGTPIVRLPDSIPLGFDLKRHSVRSTD